MWQVPPGVGEGLGEAVGEGLGEAVGEGLGEAVAVAIDVWRSAVSA
jgi:hypothetical protein